MRLIIVAIGRLKKGPEQELVKRYADRIKKSGKAVGLTSVETIEIPESKAGDAKTRKLQEANEIRARLPEKTMVWLFDERGKSVSSPQFSSYVEQCLDQGNNALSIVIGGPDGLDPDFRRSADRVLSFGALTMPHQIVRILVFEQVYRSVTILTNHPYHRE